MHKASEVLERLDAMVSAGASKPEIVRTLTALCLGWPYVFGAAGQPCTPSVRRKYAGLRPEHKDNIYKACPVLSGKQTECTGCKWDGCLCNDCRGFTRQNMAWAGIPLYGDTVSTQWETAGNWAVKGDIADMPPDAVCCIFRTGHTGLYLGEGITRHCSTNVKEEPMPGKPKWLRFGIPAGLYSNSELEAMGVHVTDGGNTPTLRRGAEGELVKSLQEYLNDEQGAGLAVDGKFGAKTEEAVQAFQRAHGLTVDGVVGPKTWAAMGGAPEDEPDEWPGVVADINVGDTPDEETDEPEPTDKQDIGGMQNEVMVNREILVALKAALVPLAALLPKIDAVLLGEGR